MHALIIGAIVGAVVAILTGQKEPDNVSNIHNPDDKPRVKPGRKAERKPIEEPVDEEPVDEEPVDEEPVDEEPVDEEPVDEEPVDEEGA